MYRIQLKDESRPAFRLGIGEDRLPILFGVLLLVLLYPISRYSYTLFHGIAEMMHIAMCLAIFAVAWHARRAMENNCLLLLGIASLFVGAIGLLHTLAYKGMGVFAQADANLPTQLWIAERYLLALALLAAPFWSEARLAATTAFLGFAVLAGVSLLSIFGGSFPVCYVEGQGLTPFKINSEYLICFMFLLSLLFFARQRPNFERPVYRLIQAAVLCSALTELAFTAYVSVYGPANLVGHYLQVLATALTYKAVVQTGVAEPFQLLSARLKGAEEKYRGIFENSVEGIFRVSLEGHFLSANTAAARILGAPSVASLTSIAPGSSPGLSRDPGWRDTVVPALREKKAVSDLEFAFLRPDGAQAWLSVSARAAVAESGDILYVEGVLRDVSEKRQIERLREDMDRIARHDLKSPLNGVMGLAEMMHKDETLPPDARENATLILESGRRMLRLITESLTLVQIEEGAYRANPVPLNFARGLGRIRNDVQPLCGRKRVELAILLDGKPLAPDAQVTVCGEEALLESLFANLIANAVEAAPEGSRVTVGLGLDGQAFSADIHNLGVIPADIRQRFFERYATSGKQGGSGLGAYAARLIARAHGGDIDCTTSETEGTHLRVRLPLSCRNEAKRQQEAAP